MDEEAVGVVVCEEAAVWQWILDNWMLKDVRDQCGEYL